MVLNVLTFNFIQQGLYRLNNFTMLCKKCYKTIVKLQVRSKGPGQGPVSSPWSRFKSELRNSKFSVKFSKEWTWRDTIIKQATTTTTTNKLFEALTIAFMMLGRSSTLTDVIKNFWFKYFSKIFQIFF